MTKRATQRTPWPILEPRPLELGPADYQPSKAELEEEFDMPGMTMDEVREVFRRPFRIVRPASRYGLGASCVSPKCDSAI